MKIGIIYTKDPVIINGFIYEIINKMPNDIVLVIEDSKNLAGKKGFFEQVNYKFSLVIILGLKDAFISLLKIFISKFNSKNKVQRICNQRGIRYIRLNDVNSMNSLKIIEQYNLDLIFNQSMSILKKSLINLPKFGVVNRHGSLLPKYRGRLSPFWQLMNNEKVGGISFHFVNEGLDTGPIVLQEKIEISKKESFTSLLDKVFAKAIEMFPKVVDKIEKEGKEIKLIENTDAEATYFTSPKVKDAFNYRIIQLRKCFNGVN